MARIKVDWPGTASFQCRIAVRITDLNYGGHVGNDTVLSLVHEARMQYLRHLGYTEMQFAGTGMIMADAAIEFKSELFYGDTVTVSMQAQPAGRIGFDLFYKLEKESEGRNILVALVKTGMICYDYEKKKIVSMPQEAVENMKM